MDFFHHEFLSVTEIFTQLGRFDVEDRHAPIENEWLVRFPMGSGLGEVDQQLVVAVIKEFYE